MPIKTFEFGEEFDVVIENIPPEVEISHAIFCKRPVAVTALQGAWRIEKIELTPEIAFAVWRGSKSNFAWSAMAKKSAFDCQLIGLYGIGC